MRNLSRLAFMVVLSTALAVSARADILNFAASIDGAQAANCGGTGSPATGSGTFTLDTVTGQVDYNITFDAGSLLGSETAAHVHGAAAECVGAGVVYGLPAGSPKIGTANLTPQQISDMIDGLHYVNIHTTAVSGGEIRGQILQTVAPVPTLGEWAMISTALLLMVIGTYWLVRRRSIA